ncbi:MAG: hypothetical protein WHS65_04545 [Melioribacteraceae bacterium]
MDTQTLEQKIQNGEINYEDFEKRFKELNSQLKEFQNQLEYITEIKKDEARFRALLQKVSGMNSSELMESLRGLGYKYKSDLKDAFKNVGYRLLEQTRAGKRADVYYGIMRIFVSYNLEFPKILLEAFKPYYSDEMFKVFIFSFLSGLLSQEQSEQ